MVLLVLGVPIVVLVLALALERLESNLLPAREVDRSDRDEVPGRRPRSGAAAPLAQTFTRPG